MQATGQYGEVPQYVGSRTGASHAHMFNLSHEMSLSSSATPGQSHAHGHSLSLSHPLANTQPSQSHIQQPPFLQSAQQQQQQQQLQQHQQQPQQHAQQGLHVNMGGAPPKTSSTGPPPPSHPPTASQQSTQTLQSSSQQTQDEIKQHQQQFHQLQQQTAHDPGNSRAQQQPGTDPVQLIKQKDQLPAEIRQGGTIMVDISSNVLQETVGQALLHKGGGTAKEELGGDGDDGDDEGERGASGNRWPRQEAIALLKIRSDMDAAFRDSSLKGPLWEEVSRKLAEMGYHRSAKKCKEKFENVHKYYKRTKEGKTGRQDGKNYRFFAQLEALYGKAGDTTTTSTITPGAPSSHLTTTPTLASKLHSSISVHQNTGPSPGSLISLNAENPLVSASSIPVNSSANHNTMHATSINHTVFSSTISNPTPLASLPPFNPTPAPAPASAAAAAAAAVAATNAHIARTLEKVESMAHDMHINDAYSDSSEEDDDDDDVDNDDDDEEDDEDNDDNDEDDDEDDEEDEFDEPVRVSTAQTATGRGKKRKRNSMKKYLIFFERVMKKILDKQEHMQQKFLEALERRDQERMIREEAWKRQEMARLNREHDVRAAERAASASRDASLVALLQKMTGRAFHYPNIILLQLLLFLRLLPHFASTSVQPLAMSNHHSTAIVPADYAQNESSIEKDYNIAFDPSSKRWPKPEVLALIKLRTSLDQRFHEPGSKAVLWEEISNSMAAQGYNRTPKPRSIRTLQRKERFSHLYQLQHFKALLFIFPAHNSLSQLLRWVKQR